MSQSKRNSYVSDLSEDMKFWNLYFKEERAKTRKRNSDGLKEYFEEKGFEFIVRSEYHFSILKDGIRVDYYPTSSKYHLLPKNKRGRISPDKIETLFVEKPKQK